MTNLFSIGFGQNINKRVKEDFKVKQRIIKTVFRSFSSLKIVDDECRRGVRTKTWPRSEASRANV